MTCCETYGDCTQGRQCPERTGVVQPHQAAHAARVANSHPHQPKVTRTCNELGLCDQQGNCSGAGACHAKPAGLSVQFVGQEPDEPTEPTRPVCDCWPLTPMETSQVIFGMCFFLAVFCGLVAFGLSYGWGRFGRDLVAYLAGVAA